MARARERQLLCVGLAVQAQELLQIALDGEQERRVAPGQRASQLLHVLLRGEQAQPAQLAIGRHRGIARGLQRLHPARRLLEAVAQSHYASEFEVVTHHSHLVTQRVLEVAEVGHRGAVAAGAVVLLGAVELACPFVQVGEAQAVADDVFGDGELADEAAVGVDEAVLALLAGGEGFEAGAQVEVVGGEGEGLLEVGEGGLGLVRALVPQAGQGRGHGGALGLAGGRGGGVGEGELFPAGVGGGAAGEGGGAELGERREAVAQADLVGELGVHGGGTLDAG